MLKNYLKIAYRSLVRHKGYTFINVAGLAVGLACCLLIALYVRSEWSYDRFHARGERIYRVLQTLHAGEEEQLGAQTSPLLARTMEASLPGVERAVRLYLQEGVVKVGVDQFKEPLLFADASFFDVFTFGLLRGDPARALDAPDAVVLSEAAAQRYFGTTDVLGRRLSIRVGEAFYDFTVSAVAAPVPETSSIQFDVLLPLQKLEQVDPSFASPNWGTLAPRTYVLLDSSAAMADVAGRLPAFVEATLPEDRVAYTRYLLQPLDEVHWSPGVRRSLSAASDPVYPYLLSGIALFILVIACINFTTLTLGRSAGRAQEVGMRKALGAVRGQLVRQFWGEAVLVCCIALGLSLVIVELTLPFFSNFFGRHLRLEADPGLLLLIGALLLGVGLLAGSYPALYLSRFHPVEVLKGRTSAGRPRRLVQALVVVQFTFSVFLIISTLLMAQQLRLVQERDLGFDKEQVVRITAEYGATWEGVGVMARYRTALADAPDVFGIAGSMNRLGGEEPMGVYSLASGVDTVQGHHFNVTPEYLETLGLTLKEGRNFSAARPTDSTAAVLVNEALVEAFGWDSPLGRPLSALFAFEEAKVIGVVEDFHYEPLYERVAPLAMYVGARAPVWHLYVRIAPGDVPATLARLKRAWHEVAPDLPFEYTFLDQEIDERYRADRRWARLIRYAALLAIAIACLGLFGLATLEASRRTKEIGIRKVLGASVTGIAVLLSKDFAKLVLVAFVLAVPVAYLAMRRWLEDFAYRIEIGAGVFFLAGGAVLLVALLTVSYRAAKAALADPVESLRYE